MVMWPANLPPAKAVFHLGTAVFQIKIRKYFFKYVIYQKAIAKKAKKKIEFFLQSTPIISKERAS